VNPADVAPALHSLASAIEQLAKTYEIALNEAARKVRPLEPWAKPGHWCTPERKLLLRELYPSHTVTPAEVRAELASCAGPPVPDWDHVGTYAMNVLKLRRGKPADTTPIATDISALRERAAIWGIPMDEPPAALLAAVNAKAARMGHRPYTLEKAHR